jgi:hypothetical protein
MSALSGSVIGKASGGYHGEDYSRRRARILFSQIYKILYCRRQAAPICKF